MYYKFCPYFNQISMLDPTKNDFQNPHIFKLNITFEFNQIPMFDSTRFQLWIQPKAVCKMCTYFNQIETYEFNKISTLVSTRFQRLIQPKTVCKIYTYFNQISMLESTRFPNHGPLGQFLHLLQDLQFFSINSIQEFTHIQGR